MAIKIGNLEIGTVNKNGKKDDRKDPMAELRKKQKEELEALKAAWKEDKVIEDLKEELLKLTENGRTEIRKFLEDQLKKELEAKQKEKEKAEEKPDAE